MKQLTKQNQGHASHDGKPYFDKKCIASSHAFFDLIVSFDDVVVPFSTNSLMRIQAHFNFPEPFFYYRIAGNHLY